MRKQREGNTLSALNCKIEVEMEPYRTLIGDDTSVTVLQGYFILFLSIKSINDLMSY